LKKEAKDTDYQYSSEKSDEESETKDKSEKPKKKSKESKKNKKKVDAADDTEGDALDAMDIEAETESQPRDTFLSEKEHDKQQYEAELKQRQEKEDKEFERRTQFIGDYDVRVVEPQYTHLWGYYGEPEEI